MACNFLVKFDGDDAYQYFKIEGCSNGMPAGAVLLFFMRHYPTIKVGNFANEVERLGANVFLWCKHIVGVSICEEKFEITKRKQNVIQKPALGPVEGNMLETTVLGATLVEEKEPVILPFLLDNPVTG